MVMLMCLSQITSPMVAQLGRPDYMCDAVRASLMLICLSLNIHSLLFLIQN